MTDLENIYAHLEKNLQIFCKQSKTKLSSSRLEPLLLMFYRVAALAWWLFGKSVFRKFLFSFFFFEFQKAETDKTECYQSSYM